METAPYALLLERLERNNLRVHVAGAGVGASLFQRLWSTPGASSVLVGGEFPYARAAFESFVGFKPTDFVSREASLDLAMASYLRASAEVARECRGAPIGVAVTASVHSSRTPKRGHRGHVAVLSQAGARVAEVMLDSPHPSPEAHHRRAEDDSHLARVALELLVSAIEPARSEKTPDELGTFADDLARERLFIRPVFCADGSRRSATTGGLYVPASLNPPHEGHEALVQAAERACAGRLRAHYLLTTTAVHKPPLTVAQVLDRVAMVRARRAACLGPAVDVEVSMNDPLFLDKARARPGSTFVLGTDAMARLFDPSWGVPAEAVLATLDATDTHFLVMGRKVGERFVRYEDVPVPAGGEHRFRPLDGRFDVSSSALRQRVPDEIAALQSKMST